MDKYCLKTEDKMDKNIVSNDKNDAAIKLKLIVKPDEVREEAIVESDISQKESLPVMKRLEFKSDCKMKTELLSKDKRSSRKIPLRGQNSRDISDYFTEKDRTISFNSALDKLNIDRSRDHTKLVNPILSQGRKNSLEKKKE